MAGGGRAGGVLWVLCCRGRRGMCVRGVLRRCFFLFLFCMMMRTYPSWPPRCLCLPRKRRFGIVRLERPNSLAIPSSRKPRKSSPNVSAKLPLFFVCFQHDRKISVIQCETPPKKLIENSHEKFTFLVLVLSEEGVIVKSSFSRLVRIQDVSTSQGKNS